MTPQTPDAKVPTGPTGPRTEAGKARTRLNTFRHGLTSREFVFSPQDAELYTQHSAALQQHFQPIGPVEIGLVHAIASGMWRLDRATAIEEGIFALALDPESNDAGALAPARAWLADGRSLNLLTTYEQRIRRALAADKAELKTLQTERSQSQTQESREATSSQPLPPDPRRPVTPESVNSIAPAPAESVCSVPRAAPPAPPNGATHVVMLVKSPAKPPFPDAA